MTGGLVSERDDDAVAWFCAVADKSQVVWSSRSFDSNTPPDMVIIGVGVFVVQEAGQRGLDAGYSKDMDTFAEHLSIGFFESQFNEDRGRRPSLSAV